MSFDIQQDKPLRVLHYCGANSGITGIETFILQLCAAQKRAGLDTSIILDVEGREGLIAIASAQGAVLRALPTTGGSAGRLPRKLATVLLRARRIARLVALIRNSDILHIHEGIFALDALLAAWIAGFGAKTIVTHHGTMTFFRQQYWNRLWAASFWLETRLAARIVVPYSAAAAEYIAYGAPKEKTTIAPYCVDEQQFTGLAATPAPQELTLIISARLVDGKGHMELVAAVARLAPRYPGLRLVIVGDGPTRQQVEAEVDRLGLRQIVTFRGQVDLHAMPEVLRGAHVMVLPSYMQGETFPLCLLEGMALGLPSIGTRWFGIPDIVKDGETGILVEPRDVDQLAQAIERFLADPEFYFRARRNALTRFHQLFTSTAISEGYIKRYRSMLADARKG